MFSWLLTAFLGTIFTCHCAAGNKQHEKVYTPFFLQDSKDKSCLGSRGFTFCNENALWLLIDRPETSKYSLVPFLGPNPGGFCLQVMSKLFRRAELTMGPCRHQGSKEWSYEFLDKQNIKLMSRGLSIARDGPFQSSISLVPSSSELHVPLFYYPTNIHEAGFYLKASSDGHCFDGNSFRPCDVAKEVLFGVSVTFSWRGGGRSFFNYADKSRCLTTRKGRVMMGE